MILAMEASLQLSMVRMGAFNRRVGSMEEQLVRYALRGKRPENLSTTHTIINVCNVCTLGWVDGCRSVHLTARLLWFCT